MASTISNHTILKRLGAGGMGEVFLAQDLKLRRQVALKVLSEKYLDSEGQRARFLREARNAAALSHPNICTVFQVGEVEEDVTIPDDPPMVFRSGTPFLAMEFLEGRALDQVIREDSPMSPGKILEIATQVAEGLAEAHKRGIVHRDLKPPNIMQTNEGRIKILDFGLAKEIRAVSWGDETTPLLETLPAQLTGEGTIMGTPAYMSPEQAMGKQVDVRSDIFSFGLILHELATGRRAFTGKSPMSILAKIIETEPEPLDQERPGLPPLLAAVRDRCLQKNPKERYQNGGELHAALLDVEQGSASESAPATTVVEIQPSRNPLASPRTWITVGLTVMVVGLLGIVAKELTSSRSPMAEVSGPTLAVLPFEHVGPPDREYLAQGVTQEVTTRLAGLRDLNVISSTSARKYANTGKSLPEIGGELGATYLLEGHVQWGLVVEGVPDTVLITTSLVNVGEDTKMMTETFREAASQLFTLQSTIANKVAEELDLAILAPARATSDRPTENADAYEAYLRGIIASQDYDEKATLQAVVSFEEAVEKDPGFALAHARLSMAHSWMYWSWFDLSEERISHSRKAVDEALKLSPDLLEAHLAMGYYHYRAERDYPKALEKFKKVLVSMPNNSDLLFALAAVQRRDGEFDPAIDNFERAAKLDPQSHIKAFEAGETFRFVRNFRQAQLYYDRSITLDPQFSFSYTSLAELYLFGKSSIQQARQVLGQAAERSVSSDDIQLIDITCSIFDQDFEKALSDLSNYIFEFPATSLVFKLWIHDLVDNFEGKKTAAESLRKILEEELTLDPESPDAHSLLGLAHAGLGEKDKAVDEGTRALELAIKSQDVILEAEMLFQLAWINTMLGEKDTAVDHLDKLISMPSWVTKPRLKIDPTFKKLGDHGRFKQMTAMGADSGT